MVVLSGMNFLPIGGWTIRGTNPTELRGSISTTIDQPKTRKPWVFPQPGGDLADRVWDEVSWKKSQLSEQALGGFIAPNDLSIKFR